MSLRECAKRPAPVQNRQQQEVERRGTRQTAEDDPGADLLLFNEGDLSGVYTHEVYVAISQSLSVIWAHPKSPFSAGR